MFVLIPSNDLVLAFFQYFCIPSSPAALLDFSKIFLSLINLYSGTAHPHEV